MKRGLLAVILLLPLALARTRAQETAYVSLLGMADSAATDRGPQAGEIPRDLAPMEGSSASASRERPETAPIAPVTAQTEEKPVYAPGPKPAKREAEKEGDAPSVSVPAQQAAPRIWTSFFSSLLPAASSVPSFEVAVSTVARARPRPASPATTASAAGAAQGFRELFAASTAPLSPER